jgi:hypothetical protein
VPALRQPIYAYASGWVGNSGGWDTAGWGTSGAGAPNISRTTGNSRVAGTRGGYAWRVRVAGTLGAAAAAGSSFRHAAARGEGANRIRIGPHPGGAAPRAQAALRNLALSMLRLHAWNNTAAVRPPSRRNMERLALTPWPGLIARALVDPTCVNGSLMGHLSLQHRSDFTGTGQASCSGTRCARHGR